MCFEYFKDSFLFLFLFENIIFNPKLNYFFMQNIDFLPPHLCTNVRHRYPPSPLCPFAGRRGHCEGGDRGQAGLPRILSKRNSRHVYSHQNEWHRRCFAGWVGNKHQRRLRVSRNVSGRLRSLGPEPSLVLSGEYWSLRPRTNQSIRFLRIRFF